jgi:hypothetical protein
MASDHKLFNCSEEYEIDYVAGLYKDKPNKTVKEFLKEKCKSNDIYHSTHAQVYSLLEANGFQRK